jgi:hypothetical protein
MLKPEDESIFKDDPEEAERYSVYLLSRRVG